MAVIGWIVCTLLAGYVAFLIVFLLAIGMGLKGLEAVPPALFLGGCAAVVAISGVLYLSPFTIGWLP